MSEQIPHIIEPSVQEQLIRDTTTMNRYLRLSRAIFEDLPNTYWYERLHAEIEPSLGDTQEDFMRLMAFKSFTVARFFPSEAQGPFQHSENNRQLSYFDPRHQVAIASTVAKLNVKAAPYKQERYEQIAYIDPLIALGMYGVMLKGSPSKLTVDRPSTLDDETLFFIAQRRYENPRSISLPFPELDQKLSELNYSPNVVEHMSAAIFKDTIYPQVAAILGGYLDDVEKVFYGPPENRFPFRYYSLPTE